MGNVKDLKAYEMAFDFAMEIFYITRKFPQPEQYGLTSQIVRSSRSVCSNIAEGYRKRKYPQHFISKLSDSDMENTETQVWIQFALHCGYIDSEMASELKEKADQIGRLLGYMINNSEKFL